MSFRAALPDPSVLNVAGFEWLPAVKAIASGVGQVYLCDSWISGVLIIVGICICSRISFAFALIGSISGMLYAYAVGASSDEIFLGLWGYNPVLAAMAIGGVFFVINWQTAIIATLCAFTSALMFGMFKIFFTVWGLPSCTFGFCSAALIFLFLKNAVPYMTPMALADITTPEGNRHLVAKRRELAEKGE